MIERRRIALAALAASCIVAGCGSRATVRPEAVVAPLDALQLGMQSYRDHQFVGAQQLFGKALALYRSVDDSRGQVIALMDLADTALVLGEHADAGRELGEAERLVTRDGLEGFTQHLELLQAQAALQAGDEDAARSTLDALLSARDLDRAIAQAATLERTRVAIHSRTDVDAWLARARDAVPGSAAPELRARLLRIEAEAAGATGDAAAARTALDQALKLYQLALYRPGIAATHEELATLDRAAHDLPAAQDHLERALDVRLWLHDRVHGAATLAALTAVVRESGDTARATRLQEMLDFLQGGDVAEWRLVEQRYERLGRP